MFLPTTRREMEELEWNELDVILVTGDAYIDSSFLGVTVIGRILHAAGYNVGIIAQPDTDSGKDILRLGEPRLFWGVSGGAMDSLVANYTASGKKRRTDDLTPGGRNDRRPDRAVIVYSNLIRRHAKAGTPIVLGGIEASLRRVSHYDFWQDRIRRSILVDARADWLVYGMGDATAPALARALRDGTDPRTLRGLCYLAPARGPDIMELPPYERVATDPQAFRRMFQEFSRQQDPFTARPLAQRQDTRYLIHNPPALPLTQQELDAVYELPFERAVHPHDLTRGPVKALETIAFSLTSHRGCYGECGFCAISSHQGRTVQWRSRASLLREAQRLAAHPLFKGIISDVGGPTANMYGFECARKAISGACPDRHCLTPVPCKNLPVHYGEHLSLLRSLRSLPGIRKVFIASGIRHDLLLADRRGRRQYLRELLAFHTSGQMKIAPEHTVSRVLSAMGKPGPETLATFQRLFAECSRDLHPKRYLSYYLMAAHPGCTESDMKSLQRTLDRQFLCRPEQVQIFTPAPGLPAAVTYHTGYDPYRERRLFVEKDTRLRERQKAVLFTALMQRSPFRPSPPEPVEKVDKPHGIRHDSAPKGDMSWPRIKTSRKKPRRPLPKASRKNERKRSRKKPRRPDGIQSPIR